MNIAENNILHQSMKTMDALYDSSAGLLHGDLTDDLGHLEVRSSSHYAVGLLARNQPGDADRAEQVIHAVLDQQILAPDEIYHGTFRYFADSPDPISGVFPWRKVSPSALQMADTVFQKTADQFFASLEEQGTSPEELILLEDRLGQALYRQFPAAFRTYDPNWREFVASAFGVALALFEPLLSPQTVKRLDSAMRVCTEASIDRNKSGLTPMNTNIELMHIFLCDFYGARFGDDCMLTHALDCAESFYLRYKEHHSIAEYNSPTYCGVDLYALALLRRFGSRPQIRQYGAELEEGLWEDIVQFYNPNLKNLSGPFSRTYEMDMSEHTSMETLLYLALGAEHQPYPRDNCELSYSPILALSGISVPEKLREGFLRHTGDRQVNTLYREHGERGVPPEMAPLCTVTAWVGENMMLGGLQGSRSTGGQLHPVTLYWRYGGEIRWMRLRRRYPGHSSGDNIHGVLVSATALERSLEIQVEVETPRQMEVYFEFSGTGIIADSFSSDCWRLPGLTIRLHSEAPEAALVQRDRGVEVIYTSKSTGKPRQMSFRMDCTEEV